MVDQDGDGAGDGDLRGASRNGALRKSGRDLQIQTRMGTGAERRRHVRVPWEIHDPQQLTLEVESPGRRWREVPFTLVDFAAGGVGVLVEEPLQAGSRIRVTFPLPSQLEEVGEGDAVELAPWTALAEVIHGREIPQPEHVHVPAHAHRPYLRGARFDPLQNEAELRLLRALYGPLPDGWGVEHYRVRRPGTSTGAKTSDSSDEENSVSRYAVLHHGKRVAWGFGSYDRARTRALSMHLDEKAEARHRKRNQ